MLLLSPTARGEPPPGRDGGGGAAAEGAGGCAGPCAETPVEAEPDGFSLCWLHRPRAVEIKAPNIH